MAGGAAKPGRLRDSKRGPTPTLIFPDHQEMVADLALVCYVDWPIRVEMTGWTDLERWNLHHGPKKGYTGEWMDARLLWRPSVLFEAPASDFGPSYEDGKQEPASLGRGGGIL